ncbi:MAG: 4Fe-4S dicluster domain-containing protein [Acidobacteria bacterium]|nr:4Fe-4S dicluster domain-containing protein [Acidobacteriota bacterium]
MLPRVPPRWTKVIDQTRCIGCHACTTACKSENHVPLSVTRTYVKAVEIGRFPQARRVFQVTRCNQCASAPCVTACPTSAMFKRPDGIVDFDTRSCVGCKACIAACPYDAIFINPENRTAEKCNFCAHRIDMGLEPACVVVCPTGALIVGDVGDPSSSVGAIISREPVTVRRPEMETQPQVFYKGAHPATLDPLAAGRPAGGLFMWSEQQPGPQMVVSGHVPLTNNSAAALLAYDVPHRVPWDWRVSLYTWTKSIAAGTYLVAAPLVLVGALDSGNSLWQWGAPISALLFLVLTGALLIADLEHPERFYLIFTRAQWGSWLVRGAFLITGYAAILTLHLAAPLIGSAQLRQALIAPGIPLALMTAVYTAYLFNQARARALWQNTLLPAHLAMQALVAGAAVLALASVWLAPAVVLLLLRIMAGAAGLHVLLIWGEAMVRHQTAHRRFATREMVAGRYAAYFWAGMAAMTVGVLAPWLGVALAALPLLGLMAYEHAYVQAGQVTPLA